ncbi:mitochondrial escape protein 2 [Coemansia sp. RSA 988]|nr:mitochondrial escape protein 2 [Coemansia sp. RSA 988]
MSARSTVAGIKGAALRNGVHRRGIHVDCIERDALENQDSGYMARYKAGLFIDNVFPLKLSIFDIRPYLMLRNQEAMQKKVACLLPEKLPYGATVSSIEPHRRDGGSIVYFKFLAAQEHEAAAETAQKVVDAVSTHLASGKGRRWYDFAPVRALAIQGIPFTEDIVRLLPSKRVKIEFHGPVLGVEEIYKELREFGRIVDITHQPSTSKDTPHWAEVRFTKLRGATSARNCVHGDVVGVTKLGVSYVKEDHEHVVLQWLKEHSKFTIPLAAAALIAAIYAVFDPIREFFVENKITHRFDLSQIPLLGNVRRAAMRSLLRRDTAPKEEVTAWTGLADQSARLASILDEPPESFVIVTGPHGAGKTRVMEQATAHKKYRIIIDANKLGAEHSELEQMTTLARQLGWWPVFNSIIGITNAIDLMVTATTGTNAGISATPASQVRKILETLALVLTNIRRDRLSHAEAQHTRKASRGAAERGYIAPVHTVSPEDIPVIVLENLMDKELKFTSDILDWAASVVEAGLAHCIVTTSNISGFHDIQRSQPHSTASLISLDDASPIEAVTLLQQQLMPISPDHAAGASAHSDDSDSAREDKHSVGTVSNDGIAAAAKTLGGRLEDLQLFVQKVKAGESATAALEDIIQRSITEVRKHAFADDAEVGQDDHTWAPEQFWYLLTELAMHEDVEYDRVRNSALFAGKDEALLGLAEAQLITMVYDNDRPSRIRAGRPVYYAAFTRIVRDPGFSSSMTVKMNNKFIDLETAKIRKAEEELALLDVFRASVDSHAALTSAMAMIAASRESSGSAKSSSGTWHRSGKPKDDDSLYPEAFIAQAANAGSAKAEAQGGSSQSWLGWLFGRSSQNQQRAKTQSGSDSSADSDSGWTGAQRPSVIAGIPHELQGRVQFLLQRIHASQLKIDRWDRECRARAECLASL